MFDIDQSLWLMGGTLVLLLAALAYYFRRQQRRLGSTVESVNRELAESEARYRLLAENASDVIWTLSLPGLRYTYISPAITRLRGLSVEQAMAETFPESVVPQQRERVRRMIDDRLARFRDGHFGPTEAQRIEVRQHCIDGQEITVEIIASLMVDESGEVVGIQGISRNVTARKRAEQARQSRESILAALASSARLMFNSEDHLDAMNRALESLGRSVDADRVYVFENYHDQHGELRATMRFEWVNDGIEAQIDNPDMQAMSYREAIPGWFSVLEAGEAVHGRVERMSEPERGLLQSQDILSIVVVPIVLDGHFRGMIGFDDCSRARDWSQAEIDALGIAAATIGAAIDGIRARQKLEYLVSTDSLTGLSSRRAFLEQARQIHREVLSDQASMALLIMDLDHFKLINDEYGHPVGDEALKAFARICRESLRPDDLIGRMGGEEFAVLLPRLDLQTARRLAEDLRLALEAAKIRLPEAELALTVSIGLALSDPADQEFSSLLKRADQALYQAKNGGRNRVKFFSGNSGAGPESSV